LSILVGDAQITQRINYAVYRPLQAIRVLAIVKSTIYKVLASTVVGTAIIATICYAATPKTITVNTTYCEEVNPPERTVVLPIPLRSVCGLESSYEGTAEGEPQQFNPNGSPRINVNYHKDGTTSTDWGACQINDRTWDSVAKKLGLDYKYSKNDNYILAAYILEHDSKGINNWISYRKNKQKVEQQQ
jgi:hypothetical protein